RLSSPSAPSRPARVLTRRFRPSPMAGNGRERLVPLLVSLRRFVTRCRRSQTLGKPKTAADKPLPPRRHRLGDLLNAYRITSLARSNRPPGVRGPVCSEKDGSVLGGLPHGQPCRRGRFRPLGEQHPEPRLVEDRHTELDSLVVLAAGVRADHHEVGLLGHRSGHLAAEFLHGLLGPVPAGQSPANQSPLGRAWAGPTPSPATSSSSRAWAMASRERKWRARSSAARGPTCRMDSATSTRHSGRRLASSSCSNSFSTVFFGSPFWLAKKVTTLGSPVFGSIFGSAVSGSRTRVRIGSNCSTVRLNRSPSSRK